MQRSGNEWHSELLDLEMGPKLLDWLSGAIVAIAVLILVAGLVYERIAANRDRQQTLALQRITAQWR